jgi:queuine tRNA-ribosyltransferase
VSVLEQFRFQLEATDGAARAGRYQTPHGGIETPTFMSVATFGAVRGVGPADLAVLRAQILLANTYHLHERPGEETIEALGGLHGFTGWRGPWLTDSGGFQVSSMGDRVTLDEEGITFSSPLDGRRRVLTPEGVVGIQQKLGSDVAMVLDECLPPVPGPGEEAAAAGQRAERAMERSLRWAERSRRVALDREMALFGIVQGGVSEALRRRSASATVGLGFDGYAHGGLGMGEERAQRSDMVGVASEALPKDLPRYLMGLGKPIDLLDGVAAGVDLFDCVVPTRNGRHGVLFTRQGRLNIKNARFRDDARPPEEGCDCPTCGVYSRAYLRHLLHIDEALGARLATLHNLRFYLRLLEDARRAIVEGSFAALRAEISATVDGLAD